MRGHRLAGVAALAGITLVSACSGDGPVDPGSVRGVSFEFAGDRSGIFEADGVPTVSDEGGVEHGVWTVAQRDSIGGIVIAGFQVATQATGDIFILQLRPAAVSDFESCGPGTGCRGRLLIGLKPETFIPDEYFEIVSGNASITELMETRVRGSFSFTARSDGGDGDETITVIGGVFDAPIVGGETGMAVRCVVDNAIRGTADPCT
jgi:hypothetical protein